MERARTWGAAQRVVATLAMASAACVGVGQGLASEPEEGGAAPPPSGGAAVDGGAEVGAPQPSEDGAADAEPEEDGTAEGGTAEDGAAADGAVADVGTDSEDAGADATMADAADDVGVTCTSRWRDYVPGARCRQVSLVERAVRFEAEARGGDPYQAFSGVSAALAFFGGARFSRATPADPYGVPDAEASSASLVGDRVTLFLRKAWGAGESAECPVPAVEVECSGTTKLGSLSDELGAPPPGIACVQVTRRYVRNQVCAHAVERIDAPAAFALVHARTADPASAAVATNAPSVTTPLQLQPWARTWEYGGTVDGIRRYAARIPAQPPGVGRLAGGLTPGTGVLELYVQATRGNVPQDCQVAPSQVYCGGRTPLTVCREGMACPP